MLIIQIYNSFPLKFEKFSTNWI